MRRLLVAFCALTSAACTTHMETRPSKPGDANGVVGVPYALPIAQHDLTVTRTLVGCKLDAEGGIEKLEFEAKVALVTRYGPGERFVVDYRELGNWHKTSGFKLATYPNQTIKSVNAEAEDRSPEIIATTVKTALTFAQIATLGAPLSLPTANILKQAVSDTNKANPSRKLQLYSQIDGITQPQLPVCPAEVAALKAANDALKKKSAELLALTRKLDALIVPALIGLATEEQKKEVQTLRKNIIDVGEQQAGIQRQLDTLLLRLRFVETTTFVPRSGQRGQSHLFAFPSASPSLKKTQTERILEMFNLPGNDLPESLVKVLGDAATLSASLDVISFDDQTTCQQAGLGAECAAPSSPKWDSSVPGSDIGRPKVIPGIAFRNPAQARLLVCKDKSPYACRDGSAQAMLLDATVSVPQLGRLVILPFHNGFGANNSVEAVFREDGSLDWLGYGVKETSGENIASLIGDGSEQLLAYRKERREQEEKELEDARAAPGKALDEQIALLKRQQELAELTAATSPDAVAQQQELTRLQAEIARLTALRQIMELDEALRTGAGG